MSEEIVTYQVEHLIFGRVEGTIIPLIHDLELAKALHYARPRKIRDLIERLWPKDPKTGKRNDIEARPTVGRIKVRPGITRPAAGEEFWLTRAQALKVAARSETEVGDAVLVLFYRSTVKAAHRLQE